MDITISPIRYKGIKNEVTFKSSTESDNNNNKIGNNNWSKRDWSIFGQGVLSTVAALAVVQGAVDALLTDTDEKIRGEFLKEIESTSCPNDSTMKDYTGDGYIDIRSKTTDGNEVIYDFYNCQSYPISNNSSTVVPEDLYVPEDVEIPDSISEAEEI